MIEIIPAIIPQNLNIIKEKIGGQIDIGVFEKTISKLKSAGVTRFVSGSAVFNSSDPKMIISRLQNL